MFLTPDLHEQLQELTAQSFSLPGIADYYRKLCFICPMFFDQAPDPRDRSILNLGMIACLGRMHEFEAHFRGALRNGVTAAEIQEVLLLLTMYCGIPAANEAHRIAADVLREQRAGTNL